MRGLTKDVSQRNVRARHACVVRATAKMRMKDRPNGEKKAETSKFMKKAPSLAQR
jgi:hypothetical protein